MRTSHEVCRTLPFDLGIGVHYLNLALKNFHEENRLAAIENAQLARRHFEDFVKDPQPITYSIRQSIFHDWSEQDNTFPGKEVWKLIYKICLHHNDLPKIAEYLSQVRHVLLNFVFQLNEDIKQATNQNNVH